MRIVLRYRFLAVILFGHSKSTFLQRIYSRIFATVANGAGQATRLMWPCRDRHCGGCSHTSDTHRVPLTLLPAFTYIISLIVIIRSKEFYSQNTAYRQRNGALAKLRGLSRVIHELKSELGLEKSSPLEFRAVSFQTTVV